MFGLSVNLILTLGSLGFTCYSLHRLDSRLTALELLKDTPYQISDPFSAPPTSAHFRPSGSLEKETGRVQRAVERCNDRIFSYRVLSCLRLKNTIFNVESLVQQSVNATSSPSVTCKQLLLVLNCNSHLSCPFV